MTMATCSLHFDLLRTQLLVLCCFTITAFRFQAASSTRLQYLNNVTDRAALLSLKDSTKDPANALSDWNINVSFCNWRGVFCSHRRQRVVALNLNGMSLQGTISPHLANLSFLHFLDLGSNSFLGSLPPELGQLSRLEYLDLSANQLEGTIPQSLCQCRPLQQLSLEHNQFYGVLSECLGNFPDLWHLSLRANQLAGTIPLAFANLSKLENVDLSHNYLVGNIPDALGSLSYLHILRLSYNNLTGVVPPSIFNIPLLQTLALTANRLTGQLPQDNVTLPSLEFLYISHNGFSGQIPRSLANCPHLQEISLSFNQFSGSIPSWLGDKHNLTMLYLGGNKFTGSIPPFLANLSQLQYLDLSENMMQGDIPNGIGSLPHLRWLSLELNNFTGLVPESIFNNSALEMLALAYNDFRGRIPQDIGHALPYLKEIYLGGNGFHGQIPASIANASGLEIIDLSLNKLAGSIPLELGSLMYLQRLGLSNNFLTDPLSTSGELSIITAMTKCRQLEAFDFSENSLNGAFPASIGNLSTNIRIIGMGKSQIRGSIPSEIANLTNLNILTLEENKISGIIPSSIGKLHNLQGLDLSRNQVEGLIPSQLYQIFSLVELNLSENMLTGGMSSSISNLSNLQKLDLHSNYLSAEVPQALWEMKGLVSVHLQDNSLTGSLPLEIGNLGVVYWMDFSANRLYGELPVSLTKLQMLQYLNLSKNSFSGHIPPKLDGMVNLVTLDLSFNSLSGEIPNSLGLLRSIQSLNLSFNQLVGEIPNDGIFANLTADSFVGNFALCGAQKFQVPMCPGKKMKHRISNVIVKTIIACTVGSFIVLVFIILLLVKSYRRKRAPQHRDSIELFSKKEHPLISYGEILHATNNFSHSNLIGRGSFGSVYKAVLFDGTVAVKVLNSLFEGAENSFNVECEVMRKVKHRNILKIITSCTNKEFKALVFRYMPCGSLDHCLYTSSQNLNLLQRLNILIDVACAMEYLHHDFFESVIHCDLKPSNVLLDENMTAYVADFGIAKLLVGRKSYTLTETLGTTGYIAPEFGQSGKVSTKVDVYSYGVLLLETLARKRPTDGMFEEGSSLRQWVAEALPHALLEVVDEGLLNEEGSRRCHGQQETAGRWSTRNELLLSVMRVGLSCSMESPAERMNMREVVARLKKIREELRISEMS